MTFNTQYHCSRILSLGLLVAMTVSLATSAMAAPQTEDIQEHGPNPELFALESIEFAVSSWKWQAELSEKQQQLIAETMTHWRVLLDEVRNEKSHLQEELASAGLSYPVDVRSIQKIDEELRVIKGELVGSNAELKKIKSDIDLEEAELQFERDSKVGELDLLATKLAMTTQEYKHVQELFNKSVVPKSSLAELKVNIAELETIMQNSKRQLQLIETRLKVDMSAAILSVAERQTSLILRIDELHLKKEAVGRLRPLQEISTLKVRSETAEQMIKMAQIRQFELQLDNIRNLALIELAEERIAKHAKDVKENADK